jgi:uncharacterized protein
MIIHDRYPARQTGVAPMPSVLDPAILFFVVGIAAGLLKSNLDIPAPISRFLSLYLLMCLGLKGGFALAHSGLSFRLAADLSAAVVLALALPLIDYGFLKRRLPVYDAIAVSATYGSVSAVTFVTATQYLDLHGMAPGGHMSAAMALMESPAIVLAVVLANRHRARLVATQPRDQPSAHARKASLGGILHEAFTDGAQTLLLGAMVVGLITGDAGKAALQPFSSDLFKGMLSFFLLDMGLVTARNFPTLKQVPRILIGYGIFAPLFHAALALALAHALGMTSGNTALLMVLAASASYIAVPAVLRYAIPEAQPAVYFGLSLGLTFPFNILVGIPLYATVARLWASSAV